MDYYVDGDYIVDDSGSMSKIYSIDEACQRVRFILLTRKESFVYNRELGADFTPIFDGYYDEVFAAKLAEQLCREALVDQKDISIERVNLTINNGEYRLSMRVVFGEEKKNVEVLLN